MRPLVGVALVLVGLLPPAELGAVGVPLAVRLEPGDATVGQRLEWRVDLDASYANPFDPREIAVHATIDDGLNTWWVDAFWYQGFEATLQGATEVLTPVGEPHFRLRWRPRQSGTYTLHVTATDRDGTAQAQPFQLVVTAPATPWPGYVRVDPEHPRRLMRDDGTPYVPFGANLCWAFGGGTHDYERRLDAMAAEGLNWTRVWMTHIGAGTALEWTPTTDPAYCGLGCYNLEAAWRIDRILDLAEARGVGVQLVLQQHSQFEQSEWPEEWGPPHWASNPWNAANGGPLTESAAFFTDPEVIAGFDRRLQYVVARYGDSPALLAWELFNEIELVKGYRHADSEAWMAGRAQALRRLDRYQHLITTSYAGPCWPGCTQPWVEPWLDLVQVHTYLPDLDLALGKAALGTEVFEKPVIVGEYGIDYLGQRNQLDPTGAHLVHGTLRAALEGFTGGAMSWWWDAYLDLRGLWPALGAPARALGAAGIEGWTERLEPLEVQGDQGEALRVWRAWVSEGAALLWWVHDPRAGWAGETPPEVAGALLPLAPLPDTRACGAIRTQLFDPWTGDDVRPPELLDDATLRLPPFGRDLLVRVWCEAPAPDPGSPDGFQGESVPDAWGPVEGTDINLPGGPSDGSGGCSMSGFYRRHGSQR